MKHRHAFTLIELLVVIAIIALLVSILMPSLQKAKEMAKDVVCASNLKNISYAIYLYAQDYEENIPYSINRYGQSPRDASTGWYHRIGRVPEDSIPGFASAQTTRIWRAGYTDYDYGVIGGNDVFQCPTAETQLIPRPTRNSGYAWNRFFSINGVLSGDFNYNQPERIHSIPLHDVDSGVVLAGDGHADIIASVYVIRPRFVCGTGGKYLGKVSPIALIAGGPWPYQEYLKPWGPSGPCEFYGHTGERSTLVFADGHVKAIKDLRPEIFNMDRGIGNR